jgi:hypothetical protein
LNDQRLIILERDEFQVSDRSGEGLETGSNQKKVNLHEIPIWPRLWDLWMSEYEPVLVLNSLSLASWLVTNSSEVIMGV